MDEIISGWEFRDPATQALEKDDFENPGFIFVEQGEELWSAVDGSEGKSCQTCHDDAAESMKGVRASMPKWNEAKGKPQLHVVEATGGEPRRLTDAPLGVTDARCGDFTAVTGERFDTIVLLMHGIGLVGTLAGLAGFFDEAQNHLNTTGRIIFDSADLGIVMPEQFDEGLDEWRSGGLYPGEVEYRLTYEDFEGEPYPWLFVDPITLADRSQAANLRSQIVARGARGTFLARVTT